MVHIENLVFRVPLFHCRFYLVLLPFWLSSHHLSGFFSFCCYLVPYSLNTKYYRRNSIQLCVTTLIYFLQYTYLECEIRQLSCQSIITLVVPTFSILIREMSVINKMPRYLLQNSLQTSIIIMLYNNKYSITHPFIAGIICTIWYANNIYIL